MRTYSNVKLTTRNISGKAFFKKIITILYLFKFIRNHWDDMGDENGFQCTTCGKVFGSGNKTAYVKHLATHDDDSQ